MNNSTKDHQMLAIGQPDDFIGRRLPTNHQKTLKTPSKQRNNFAKNVLTSCRQLYILYCIIVDPRSLNSLGFYFSV